MVTTKKKTRRVYNGRKRGAKPKGGFYGTLAFRVPSREIFDKLADLLPSERGAALIAGAQLLEEQRAANTSSD